MLRKKMSDKVRLKFVSAYLPKRLTTRQVAGLLTCLFQNAFPSCDSDMLFWKLWRLTAAGTVQDLHLFPFQNFTWNFFTI